MFEKLKINGKLLRELDFGILLAAIIIVIFGALNIYSATRISYGFQFFKLQIIWLVLGLIAVYLILLVDYSVFMNYATVIYWVSMAVLGVTDVFGHTSHGATGWLAIGSRMIQPSEFAKLGMIIMLAKKLDDMEGNINNPKNFFILCFYAIVPMALIVVQPDMGMTMVCFFIVLGIFYTVGLDLRVIFGGIGGLIASIALVWKSGLIQPYQQKRITALFNQNSDPSGFNLQLQESLKSIGSGGILGKGFLKGTQVAGNFIPEAHNDMIFAVVGEEWGLVGGLALLLLYGIIIYKLIKIAKNSKDIFGSVLCIGVISTFLFLVLQNIGMAIGIMPITGVTLPLMSYGGSSILTTFIALAIALNVGMRKKKINF